MAADDKSTKRGNGFKDETGKVYGKLTVIERGPNDGNNVRWKCQCECGNVILIRGSRLRSGEYDTCGAMRCGNPHYGMSSLAEHKCWKHMFYRCYSPSNCNFPRYGARGVTVCERWESFDNFLQDMGRKPFPEASIGRIDNSGHYEPSNCRWETDEEQQNNTSRTRMLTFNGKAQSLSYWARECGIAKHVINNRLLRGWSVDSSLTTPVRKYNNHDT